MEHGTNCHLSSCLTLSFLPLSCPFCQHLYCESHFLPDQHACSAPGGSNYRNVLSETELLKRIAKVNGGGAGAGEGTSSSSSSSSSRRLPCQRSGCKKFSLEVASVDHQELSETQTPRVAVKDGSEVATTSDAQRAFAHKAPTCTNCHALFCITHLDPRDHDCPAKPKATPGQERMLAAEERKRKAREVLAKNFPQRGMGAGKKT